jgi:hypothetical protein
VDERRVGDALEHAWDAVRRGETPPADLDAGLVETLRAMQARDHVPPPDPTFIADLREELMTGPLSPAVAPVGGLHMPNGRPATIPWPTPTSTMPRSLPPRGWGVGQFATAVLVLLTVVGGFFAFRAQRLPPPDEWAILPAIVATPLPARLEPEACRIGPRSIPNLQVVARTPVPRVDPAAPIAALLRTAEPASVETVAAITRTVFEVVACRNAGDDARLFALFTDDGLRSIVAPLPAGFTWDPDFADLATPPTAVAVAERATLLAIDDVLVLPDRRIAARVTVVAGDGATQEALFVFVPQGERYLVDALIAPVPPISVPGHG